MRNRLKQLWRYAESHQVWAAVISIAITSTILGVINVLSPYASWLLLAAIIAPILILLIATMYLKSRGLVGSTILVAVAFIAIVPLALSSWSLMTTYSMMEELKILSERESGDTTQTDIVVFESGTTNWADSSTNDKHPFQSNFSIPNEDIYFYLEWAGHPDDSQSYRLSAVWSAPDSRRYTQYFDVSTDSEGRVGRVFSLSDVVDQNDGSITGGLWRVTASMDDAMLATHEFWVVRQTSN